MLSTWGGELDLKPEKQADCLSNVAITWEFNVQRSASASNHSPVLHPSLEISLHDVRKK